MSKFCKSALLAVQTLLLFATPLASRAAPEDYRFELAGQPEKSGTAIIVRVRLMTVADGKPVPGAEIVETRLDMGPDGMAAMTPPVMTLASTEPGVLNRRALLPQVGMAVRLGRAVRNRRVLHRTHASGEG